VAFQEPNRVPPRRNLYTGTVTVRNFLRALGAIYAIAFVSFGVQAAGLIGSHGIVPVADYLRGVGEAYGAAGYQLVPTLWWLGASDFAIAATWVLGAAAGLWAVFGPRPRVAIGVCLVLWLSICAGGQDFMSFQWDVLLVEVGFLGLFADARPVRVFLFRWLLFRLMFFSGVVKLMSGDPTWRSLDALRYHYETQPLPLPTAWLMHQLPPWWQRGSAVFMFAVELGAPFLFFAPRRFRRIGAWATIALQVLIMLTGNYTFFNLLTIALCMWLFIEPDRSPTTLRHRTVSATVAGLVAMLSCLSLCDLFRVPMPEQARAVMDAVGPLRIFNSYGLFAVMTVARAEIVVEGSDDGTTWKAYEFPYKPGDLRRAPPIVAPHQPRLDWQMWFASLGRYQQHGWFVNLMLKLLRGEPAVAKLLAYNPFPGKPPKYIRALLYDYHFTKFGQPGWWTRELRTTYFPPVALK
jgi:lipase maturation factor 1